VSSRLGCFPPPRKNLVAIDILRHKDCAPELCSPCGNESLVSCQGAYVLIGLRVSAAAAHAEAHKPHQVGNVYVNEVAICVCAASAGASLMLSLRRHLSYCCCAAAWLNPRQPVLCATSRSCCGCWAPCSTTSTCSTPNRWHR
jgi:hypothetical protein